MATPLELIYNGTNLHDLGVITIASQSSTYSPDTLPQLETRQIVVRVDAWASSFDYNYDTLYANIKAVRAALATQNKILKWISPNDGATQLERPVKVIRHNLPEDPNAVGVMHQQIEIVFEYEVNRTQASALTLTLTGVGKQAIDMGHVTGWKDDLANAFYSEWKNVRRRSSGSVTARGEIFVGLAETGATSDTRPTQILAKLTALKDSLLAGSTVHVTYAGPTPQGGSADTFFDKDVKLESFSADVDQDPNTGKIRWSMTFSYSAYPDDSAIAAAEFTSALSKDQESGRQTLTLSGRIVAVDETTALSKLASLTASILSSYSMSSVGILRDDVTKQWVNANDTGGNDQFLELSFSRSYDQKIASVLSYALSISDSDNAQSGLLTRTYSGWVVANGADETAAYNAALAQARTLGDKKHDFRVSKEERRSDRKLNSQAGLEFMRLEFSYVYQIKGDRTYLEANAATQTQTYGEDSFRVSGYVTAASGGAMYSAYAAFKALYSTTYIRDETTEMRSQQIQRGPSWTATGTDMADMALRLEFQFTVFQPKSGVYSTKYQIETQMDYVGLLQNTVIRGVFFADTAQLNLIEAETVSGNHLLAFLNSFVATYGQMVRLEKGILKESVNTESNSSATPTGISFNATYQKRMSTTASVLSCSLTEDLTYTGTRWVEQPNPSGASTFQNCGKVAAVRVVSGTVTAATENSAMTYLNTIRAASGLWNQFRETAPSSANRFEDPAQVSITYVFAPLTTGSAGSNRANGTGANFQVCEMRFRFTEHVPNYMPPFG